MASESAEIIANCARAQPTNRARRAAAGALAVSLNIPISLAAALVLTPFYLRRLGEAQYGAWLAAGYLFSVLGLADPGVGETLTRQISHSLSREIGRDTLSMLRFTTACSAFLGIVIVIAGGPTAWLLTRSMAAPMRSALLWGVGALAIQLAAGALASIPAGFERSGIQGLVSVASGLCGSIVSAVGVAACGVVGLGLGLFATAVMYLVGTLFVAWQVATPLVGPTWVRPAFTKRDWRHIKPFLSAKVVSKLGGLMLGEIDRVFIAVALGTAAVPVFALTKRPGDMARQFLVHASWASVAPLTGATTRSPQQSGRLVRAVWRPLTALCVIAATSVYWLTPGFVRLWVGDAQFAGRTTLALLCVYFVCAGICVAHNNLLWALGAIRWLPWVTILEGTVYTSGAIVAVRHWGYVGIATMMCVGQLFVALPATSALLYRSVGINIVPDLARFVAIAGLTNWAISWITVHCLNPIRSWPQLAVYGAVVALLASLPFARTIVVVCRRLRG